MTSAGYDLTISRLPLADAVLPPRISELPFDILLLVHWQESLHKCTGVHAAALCDETSVQLEHWAKDRDEEKFVAFVRSLNHERDVVLFPSETSTPADLFPWQKCPRVGESKWRLVVLEASWTLGKKMVTATEAFARPSPQLLF